MSELTDLAILRAVEECGNEPTPENIAMRLRAEWGSIQRQVRRLCVTDALELHGRARSEYRCYRLTATGRARLEEG